MPDAVDKSKLKVDLSLALREVIYSMLAGGSAAFEAGEDAILGGVESAGESAVPLAREKSAVVASAMSAVLASIEPWVRALADVLIQLSVPVATKVLQVIGDARKDSSGPIAEVIAEAMGELLGTDVGSDDIPAAGDIQQNAARARAIGGKLHDVLLAEFSPEGEVTPESGERAARAFTGFNINFGVTSAFIAIVAEMFSLGQLKEFRELGVEVAENLGLGRLHRMAMKPLFDNTVSKPYDRLLRARYRQDQMSEAQFTKALHRGTITEEEVRLRLAEKGLPDDYINEVIAQATLHLSDNELEKLVRHGVIPYEQAIAQFRADGWSEENANLKYKAIELSQVDSIVDSMLAIYRGLVQDRYMDTDLFARLLSELPISETRKVWEIRLAGATLDFPHARVTQAELTTMLEKGIVDLDYADAWAKGKGYSDEDALNLELLYFSKEDDKAAKAAAAAAKAQRAKDAACEKLKAKGLPCPP